MILDEIIAEKRRVVAGRAPVRAGELESRLAALAPPRPFAAALRDPARKQIRAIAELKRRSPSAGPLKPGADPKGICVAYETAGAAALSILTDEKWFDGRAEHLAQVRQVVRVPLLRKDFLLDERDLFETRLLGADAALLIARVLGAERLVELVRAARGAGLDALVETHEEREIEWALAAGADVIGVNHRNLDTLAVDLSLSARARALVGPEPVLVAESGIRTRADAQAMLARGCDAILVGEALLRAPDPGAALRELLCS